MDRGDIKIRHSMSKRKYVASEILRKYDDKIPVIVECDPKAKIARFDKNKCKFLVPKDITMMNFINEIRKKLMLGRHETMTIYIDNIIPPVNHTMNSIYDKFKDEDGFLYFVYGK